CVPSADRFVVNVAAAVRGCPLGTCLPPPDPRTNQCSGSPLKRRERNARRWRLLVFQWIYELTGARHALLCFVTHVESGSSPENLYSNGIGKMGKEPCQIHV